VVCACMRTPPCRRSQRLRLHGGRAAAAAAAPGDDEGGVVERARQLHLVWQVKRGRRQRRALRCEGDPAASAAASAAIAPICAAAYNSGRHGGSGGRATARALVRGGKAALPRGAVRRRARVEAAARAGAAAGRAACRASRAAGQQPSRSREEGVAAWGRRGLLLLAPQPHCPAARRARCGGARGQRSAATGLQAPVSQVCPQQERDAPPRALHGGACGPTG
jgi:hypothetical protein